MHVRIAWEIYYHQNRQNPDKLATGSSGNSNSASTSVGPQVGNSAGNAGSGNANVTPNNNVSVSQSGVVTSLSNLGAGPSPSVSSLNMKASPALTLSAAPSPHLLHRPGELPPAAAYAGTLPGRSPFETSPLSASFIGAPPSHIGMSGIYCEDNNNFQYNHLNIS